ncbi:MAG: hypothetical protein ABIP50_03360 [Candidatus Saccharimonadales bacterium]
MTKGKHPVTFDGGSPIEWRGVCVTRLRTTQQRQEAGLLVIRARCAQLDTLAGLDRLSGVQSDIPVDDHPRAKDDITTKGRVIADPGIPGDSELVTGAEAHANENIVLDAAVSADSCSRSKDDIVADDDVEVHEGIALENDVVAESYFRKDALLTDLGAVTDDDFHELAAVLDDDIVTDVNIVFEPDVATDRDALTDSEASADLHLDNGVVRVGVAICFKNCSHNGIPPNVACRFVKA